MPRIFDNIRQKLLPALCDTLERSDRADFCVGYFNLRGWKQIDCFINPWRGGDGNCCRLLVGMQPLPQDELRTALRIGGEEEGIDQQTALRQKKKMAKEFRDQLMLGAPNNEDEAALRRLAAQIKAKKVVVKLYLRHPLHAKLYLLFRSDPNNPITGFVGSSNLTFSGLAKQGELNVDVLDHDACEKLAAWFEERWNDRWCMDISEELVSIIDESWAREELIPPYHIYLKMAYHLSEEARSGLSTFRIPSGFQEKLFEFQKAAVQIAAHHLDKRGGVLIGDVVGLGKTLMAAALARIFQENPYGLETLILCPKNLVKMWQSYVDDYRLYAKVLSITSVSRELPGLRRYRIVLIDESHNLRNREGRRYQAIQDYIRHNNSRVILLSATPYNKTYLDLANQLRLFVSEDQDLGIRPERKLREPGGEIEFLRKHQCPVRSLAAFEKSDYPDDWRELMRLYMVRRTRRFIQANYAETDPANGRKFLTMEDGERSYFPTRVPKTLTFPIDDRDPNDPYARLFSDELVTGINSLTLPRYGLGNYVAARPQKPPTPAEAKQLDGLSRAGKRLMGFCRINLFKRLESGGPAFLQSVERHILRNFVFLHAIENGLDLPLGTQEADLLDTRGDEDTDPTQPILMDADEENDGEANEERGVASLRSEAEFRRRAAEVYASYAGTYKKRFKWLRPTLFNSDLADHLQADAARLLHALRKCETWNPDHDAKLKALLRLLTETHPNEKVLIFSQFADTVRYLATQLTAYGVTALAGVTGNASDPTAMAWRFSPESNRKRDRIRPEDELRVLVATDVLSEGQNLQDAAIVVNYDLPWAIIRLIQRAGRVDRIGQKAEAIYCYSFWPADGVERIIRLRSRVRQRLQENAEIVGADESFFEDDSTEPLFYDLFTEKSGILDGDADAEVDLASQAFQIWKNAVEADPALAKPISRMPNVVFSTRTHTASVEKPKGVLVYTRTAEGNDALAWIDEKGRSITQSQLAILEAAACESDTPAIPRDPRHHELVQKGVEHILSEERSLGGELGRPSGARFRSYERLKQYRDRLGKRRDLFVTEDFVRAVEKAMDDIFRYPLQAFATTELNRLLRGEFGDQQFVECVLSLREENRLCRIQEETETTEETEPQIICSLGLF